MSEQRRVWGTYLQRGGQLNDALGGGSITVLGILRHADGAYRPVDSVRRHPFATQSDAMQSPLPVGGKQWWWRP